AMLKVKLYRPFPEDEIFAACAGAKKIGVLDRNYAAGVGGIFWHDLRAMFQGRRDDLLIQDYLTGLCGGDVTPAMVGEVIDDIQERTVAEAPIWKGIDR
ncbi:MAG: pyruvate ferredoxin oxidoreductase, partial [bacterium]|nr:pyruvate ferredoxin oxidoreductase [bacterium]